MAIEIVDFPIKNGGSFHGKMLVHQRVWSTWMGLNQPMEIRWLVRLGSWGAWATENWDCLIKTIYQLKISLWFCHRASPASSAASCSGSLAKQEEMAPCQAGLRRAIVTGYVSYMGVVLGYKHGNTCSNKHSWACNYSHNLHKLGYRNMSKPTVYMVDGESVSYLGI